MPKKLLAGVLSLFATLSLIPGCEAVNSVSNPISQSIATLGRDGIYVSIGAFTAYGYIINVDLTPTKYAVANKNYIVDLYENGKLRASSVVSFNQPEINVQADKFVIFPATTQE
jgi:hypothetical protein